MNSIESLFLLVALLLAVSARSQQDLFVVGAEAEAEETEELNSNEGTTIGDEDFEVSRCQVARCLEFIGKACGC